MQAWRPANLGVSHAFLGKRDDQLDRRAPQGGVGLKQGDWQVEVGEQLRLVRTSRRRDHALLRVLQADVQTDRRGELHGGLRAQRPVEMLVKLGFREPPKRLGEVAHFLAGGALGRQRNHLWSS